MSVDQIDDQELGSDTLFRDVLSLALLGFMAIIIFILPHIAPKEIKKTSEVPSPGSVVVEITWPQDTRSDMDLWVQGPGEVPVGYSNQGGKLFNLLRDDLGRRFDLSSINYESAYSRGFQPGEYIVNVHAFRIHPKATVPFDVELAVSSKVFKDDGVTLVPILARSTSVERQGEEFTLARFSLTENGDLVEGSVNEVFQPLRSGEAK